MANFETLETMALAAFEAIRPAERLSVTEAAERYHMIRLPGAHTGPWSSDKTPYLREPQDVLTSLEYTAMVFVGPARTGKSAMLLNWLAHTALVDPADMMLVHMSRDTAREWSKSDLARMLRQSDEVRARLRPGRGEENIFDREFTSGMRFTVTWPTVNNLSGKTIPRLWLADRDRMRDDIDGEGDPFDLTRKRAQTFKRFGMTGCESSPGREVENPKHVPTTPHEAPPCRGILGTYNRGDRRRWYWRCPQCDDAFEGDFSHLRYVDSQDVGEAAESVEMVCPHCGFPMPPSMKHELNLGGRWVRDGLVWLPAEDRVVERPGQRAARSDIASFWLKGPAAGFQEWPALVRNYLYGLREWETKGDEEALKTTINVDQGLPYISRARVSERLPEDLKARAEEWDTSAENPTVPEGVRFLLPTVDVQGNSFVVQVHGFTADRDLVVIDGYKIRWSDRRDANGEQQPVDPGAFAEDWKLLTSRVLHRAYPLGDGSGRMMRPRMMGVDSGGREGVTSNAYDWWRSLRASGDHLRVALVKGYATENSPLARVTWPDSSQKDKAAARGDIPVVLLHSDRLKDQIAGLMGRTLAERAEEAAPGAKLRYPHWFEDWFYTQMTSEVKTPKGWLNPAKRRNEAWDLAYYALGLAQRPADPRAAIVPHIGLDRINWSKPPAWAEEWDRNALVSNPGEAARFERPRKARPSLAELAQRLA